MFTNFNTLTKLLDTLLLQHSCANWTRFTGATACKKTPRSDLSGRLWSCSRCLEKRRWCAFSGRNGGVHLIEIWKWPLFEWIWENSLDCTSEVQSEIQNVHGICGDSQWWYLYFHKLPTRNSGFEHGFVREAVINSTKNGVEPWKTIWWYWTFWATMLSHPHSGLWYVDNGLN